MTTPPAALTTDSAVGRLAQGEIFIIAGAIGPVGGASRASLLLCRDLAKLGRRVRVYVANKTAANVVEEMDALGVRVCEPPLERGWKWGLPKRSLVLRAYLDALLRQPAVIQCVGIDTEAKMLLRLPRLAPLYLWETTEALPHIKFVRLDVAPLLHRAAAVLVPSQTIAKNVRETYGYQGRIVLLPFWVEPATTAPVNSVRRTRKFLYIGRFDREKGLDFLVDAFRTLTSRFSNVTLTLCGGSGDAEFVRGIARGCSAIEVRGAVDGVEFERQMGCADAVILPSLHEGYPLTLLEACARGKPVIATEVGSVPEIFGGRPCAILVPPRHADALAMAVAQLLTETDEVYESRRRDAFLAFEQLSSTEVVKRRLVDVYR
jgi:glycosyltransferase involved in cell wall biosynthesis